MSLRHSVKHLTCNNAQQWWKMHEHSAKYAIIHAKTATQGQHKNKHSRLITSQSKNGKNFHKIRTPTHFRKKIPKIWNLNLNYCKILEKLEESALEDISWKDFAERNLKLMGFWRKNEFGLRWVQREAVWGKCLWVWKIVTSATFSLKTRVFRGLGSSKRVMKQSRKEPLKHKCFREKLLVAN